MELTLFTLGQLQNAIEELNEATRQYYDASNQVEIEKEGLADAIADTTRTGGLDGLKNEREREAELRYIHGQWYQQVMYASTQQRAAKARFDIASNQVSLYKMLLRVEELVANRPRVDD